MTRTRQTRTELEIPTSSLTSGQQSRVRALVRRVGNEICAERDRLPQILTETDGLEWKEDETGYRSPVTPLDKKASDALIERLCGITPNIPVMSEEMPHEDQQSVLAEAIETAKKNNRKAPTY